MFMKFYLSYWPGRLDFSAPADRREKQVFAFVWLSRKNPYFLKYFSKVLLRLSDKPVYKVLCPF